MERKEEIEIISSVGCPLRRDDVERIRHETDKKIDHLSYKSLTCQLVHINITYK